MTLVPPITTCPGQTVMFNCTANGVPIEWSVITPNMNYTDLHISDVNRKVMDGIIMADLIALDVSTIPITVVSSLTVNVTAELEGSKVQCLGVTNGSDTETKSGFIHITGDYYLLIRHIKRCSLSVEVKSLRRLYVTVRFFMGLKLYNTNSDIKVKLPFGQVDKNLKILKTYVDNSKVDEIAME